MPEPLEEPYYTTRWVVLLPNAQRLGKAPKCMPTSTPWWRRLGRQLVPRRTGRDCCWYHQGDWHKVNKTAIRFLHQAQRAGISTTGWDDNICTYVMNWARGEGITGWDLEALTSLFIEPIQVQRCVSEWLRDYGEGQHRSHAMIDTGVRRTVVLAE